MEELKYWCLFRFHEDKVFVKRLGGKVRLKIGKEKMLEAFKDDDVMYKLMKMWCDLHDRGMLGFVGDVVRSRLRVGEMSFIVDNCEDKRE